MSYVRVVPPLRSAAMFLLLAVAFALPAEPKALPPSPIPIATINPIIGDLSFVVRYGRAPTAADDPVERVATHLAFAERILRAHDVSSLSPELRASRSRLLDRLAAYARARRFPRGESAVGRLPTWQDDAGTRCAVADMVDSAAGPDTVRALDARFHNAFVAQFDDPAFDAFVASSGLTRAELAIVQPTYGPDWGRPDPPPALQLSLAGTIAVGVATDAAHADTPVLALVDGGAWWTPGRAGDHVADPVVAFDGRVGWASGDHVPYALSAQIGAEREAHYLTGIVAGLRVDADGDRIPRALTIPIDAYAYLPKVRHAPRIGLTGGPRFAIAGADRGLGWSVGVDFVARNLLWEGTARLVQEPDNLHVKIGVEHVADVTFVALTVGMASRDRAGD